MGINPPSPSLGVNVNVQLKECFKKPDPSWVKPILNRPYGFSKPHGGMWTSSLEHQSPFKCAWVEWACLENFRQPPYTLWALEVEESAKVYTIDSLEDLKWLVESYPPRHEDDQLLRNILGSFPDWEAVAEDYDGVHLTAKGERETRLTHPHNLYGWDCESTLWFRWVFTKVSLYRPVLLPTGALGAVQSIVGKYRTRLFLRRFVRSLAQSKAGRPKWLGSLSLKLRSSKSRPKT